MTLTETPKTKKFDTYKDCDLWNALKITSFHPRKNKPIFMKIQSNSMELEVMCLKYDYKLDGKVITSWDIVQLLYKSMSLKQQNELKEEMDFFEANRHFFGVCFLQFKAKEIYFFTKGIFDECLKITVEKILSVEKQGESVEFLADFALNGTENKVRVKKRGLYTIKYFPNDIETKYPTEGINDLVLPLLEKAVAEARPELKGYGWRSEHKGVVTKMLHNLIIEELQKNEEYRMMSMF